MQTQCSLVGAIADGNKLSWHFVQQQYECRRLCVCEREFVHLPIKYVHLIRLINVEKFINEEKRGQKHKHIPPDQTRLGLIQPLYHTTAKFITAFHTCVFKYSYYKHSECEIIYIHESN